jgi:hypothetical protein
MTPPHTAWHQNCRSGYWFKAILIALSIHAIHILTNAFESCPLFHSGSLCAVNQVQFGRTAWISEDALYVPIAPWISATGQSVGSGLIDRWCQMIRKRFMVTLGSLNCRLTMADNERALPVRTNSGDSEEFVCRC